MYRDIVVLFFKYFGSLFRMIVQAPIRAHQAKQHLKTYQTLPPSECKNTIVIGASFSGTHLTKLLSQSLPTGHRIILIDPSTHFNYTFNFPRYSVLSGSEYKSFIPRDGFFATAPAGIYSRITDSVKTIRDGEVELLSGEVLPYEYLAIATGAAQSPPAKLAGKTKRAGSEELRVLQGKVKDAKNIALVGGGAVGVQLAGDIKTFYPEKRVVLIHSREQLLPNFNYKLHEYVMKKMEALGIEVVLGERPVLKGEMGKWEAESLAFKDGREESFDLVIPCTGQTPNSAILANFADECISTQSGRILVHPTLQLKSDLQKENDKFSKVFALGDVAEANAPRMARAGMMQAEIVRDNIVSQIKGSKMLRKYESLVGMEGILKLSLGKDENVTFVPDEGNGGYLFPGKSTNMDLDVDRSWPYFGADLNTAADLEI